MSQYKSVDIKTVLCPVDFTTISEREIEVASEICMSFNARLVLHHNLTLAPPGMAKAWEWEETHPPPEDVEAQVEAKMDELLKRIRPEIHAEATISHGLVVPVLLHLAEKLPADLIVLGSHGWSSEEHASVAERLLDRCPCPVLTIQESGDEGMGFHLLPWRANPSPWILVPTDFSTAGDEAVQYAFDLARVVPVKLHLLHILSAHAQRGPQAAEARERLRAMVPTDLAGRVDCTVESGPVPETILAAARRLLPELIVMGRHARGLLRRFLTHDNARDMLHRANCPVWFTA